MGTSTQRLFDMFLHSDLQQRVEWNGNRISAISVCGYYREVWKVPDQIPRPIPTDEQLEAIKEVLEAIELAEEDFTHTEDVSGILVQLPAIRFTKKR